MRLAQYFTRELGIVEDNSMGSDAIQSSLGENTCKIALGIVEHL